MKVLLLGGNGYIGSKYFRNCKFTIQSVDICLFNKNLNYSYPVNYDFLDISNFDVIVCLAGHSSVPMCEHSPETSWVNNVTYFKNLCQKLKHSQKLIYASSASVYGTTAGVSTEQSQINFNVLNHYDLQKITIDLIANKYIAEGKNIIGLRFGTVNGASPNTRSDLMINSMVISAINNGIVNVKNSHIRRAILGINDLCNALDICIEKSVKPGQYNLSSFNSTVNEIAHQVSEITGAKIVTLPNDKLAYDFELSTDKFSEETGYTFVDTISYLITDLKNQMHKLNFDVRDNDRFFKLYYTQ